MSLKGRIRAMIPPPLQEGAIILKDGMKMAMRRRWYRSGSQECTACGARANVFGTYRDGRDPVPNEVCPCCGAHARHRLMALYLRERTDLLRRPASLLHVAPELSFWQLFRSTPTLRYVSADLCSPLAAVQLDLTQPLFADGAFDVIICNHVLEHIPDDAAAMRQLVRMLKPGGWALLQVPIDWNRERTDEDPSITDRAERTRRFGQWDHVRVYGRDYLDRLAAAGFVVEVDDYVKTLPAETVARYRLDGTERIVIGRKPAG